MHPLAKFKQPRSGWRAREGCIFGNSSQPAQIVQAPPPPPPVDNTNPNTPEAKTAATNAKNKAILASGLASTINTSPLGDQSQAPTQKSTLLGNA